MSYLPKFRSWVQRARQRLAEYRQTIEHELARARNRGLALIAAPHPVVGRYRTIATWRLSFHCGMNAADASAWQGWPGPRRQTALVRQRGEGPDSAPIRPIHGGRVRQRAEVRNGRADDARDPP